MNGIVIDQILTPFTFLDGIVTQYAPLLQAPINTFTQVVAGITLMFLTTWLAYRGIMIACGESQDPIIDTMKEGMKKTVLCTLAIGTTFATGYISAIPETSERLAEIFGGSKQTTAWNKFDKILVKHVMEGASLLNMGEIAETFIKDTSKNKILHEATTAWRQDEIAASNWCADEGIKIIEKNSKKPADELMKLLLESASKALKDNPSADVIFQSQKCAFKNKDKINASWVDKMFGGAGGFLSTLEMFFTNFMVICAKIVIIITTFSFGCGTFILVAMNKLFLIVCLSFAPIMIFSKAWSPTSGYFSAWMNSALGYCFTYPILYLIITLAINLYEAAESMTTRAKYGVYYFLVAIAVAIMSAMFRGLITKVGDVVSSLFSGRNESDGAASYANGALSSSYSAVNKGLAPMKMAAGGIMSGMGAIASGVAGLFTGGAMAAGGGLLARGAGMLIGGVLAPLTALGTAAWAGWEAGSFLSDKLDEYDQKNGTSWGDKIGSGIAHTLAFFGNDTAQEAIAMRKSAAEKGYM